MRLTGKNEVHGEPIPVPLYPPQISDYLESYHGLHSQRPETKPPEPRHLMHPITCITNTNKLRSNEETYHFVKYSMASSGSQTLHP